MEATSYDIRTAKVCTVSRALHQTRPRHTKVPLNTPDKQHGTNITPHQTNPYHETAPNKTPRNTLERRTLTDKQATHMTDNTS